MSQQLRKIRPLVIFIWTWLPCGTRLFKDHSQKTCLGMIEIEKFGICYLNLKKSNLEMSNQLWWSNHFSNLIWIWLPSGARNFSWAILKSTNQSTVGKVPKVMQKFKYSPFVKKYIFESAHYQVVYNICKKWQNFISDAACPCFWQNVRYCPLMYHLESNSSKTIKNAYILYKILANTIAFMYSCDV